MATGEEAGESTEDPERERDEDGGICEGPADYLAEQHDDRCRPAQHGELFPGRELFVLSVYSTLGQPVAQRPEPSKCL